MSKKRKLPVLTETSCAEIDLIRKIAEVLTGKVARLIRYDFNTGRGQLSLGDAVQEFCFQTNDCTCFHFATMNLDRPWEIYSWNIVLVDKDGIVRIASMSLSNTHRDHNNKPLFWVGDSATNRWEEPALN